jgi:Ca2+-binding EF-hand superfamily protein
MKIYWLAICTICSTPLVFAEGGQEQQQQQKRFGDGIGLPAYLAQYDVNGDGVIGEEERQVMELARDQIRKQLRSDWDADGNGTISDQERDQAKVRLRDMITESRVARFWEAEDDADGDEELSYAEFILLPGMANKIADKPEVVAAIFDRLDSDGSDTVSLDEFLAAVKQCDQARDGTSPGTGGSGNGGSGGPGGTGGSGGGGSGGGGGK